AAIHPPAEAAFFVLEAPAAERATVPHVIPTALIARSGVPEPPALAREALPIGAPPIGAHSSVPSTIAAVALIGIEAAVSSPEAAIVPLSAAPTAIVHSVASHVDPPRWCGADSTS